VRRTITDEECVLRAKKCKDEIITRFFDGKNDVPWRSICARTVSGKLGSAALSMSFVDFGNEYWVRGEMGSPRSAMEMASLVLFPAPNNQKAWMYPGDVEICFEVIREFPLLKLEYNLIARHTPVYTMECITLTAYFYEPCGLHIVVRMVLWPEVDFTTPPGLKPFPVPPVSVLASISWENPFGGCSLVRLYKISPTKNAMFPSMPRDSYVILQQTSTCSLRA